MKTLPPLRLNGLPEPRNPAVLVPLEDWPERDPGICWRNEWIHNIYIYIFFQTQRPRKNQPSRHFVRDARFVLPWAIYRPQTSMFLDSVDVFLHCF